MSPIGHPVGEFRSVTAKGEMSNRQQQSDEHGDSPSHRTDAWIDIWHFVLHRGGGGDGGGHFDEWQGKEVSSPFQKLARAISSK